MSDEKRGQARLFDALTTKGTAFTVERAAQVGPAGPVAYRGEDPR